MQLVLNRLSYYCSSLKVPIVDITKFLTESPGYDADCKIVAQSLHKFGCLVIKDPRVNPHENDTFLDQMEQYFSRRGEAFYKGDVSKDFYPQYNYQVGATPESTQRAKQHQELFKNLPKGSQSQTPVSPPYDAKWRYFWNVGDVMPDIQPNQVPESMPKFKEVMEAWGTHMINGCETVAQMAAIGLGFQRSTFSKLMKRGPHKLAPTGADLNKYDVGTVFAGFHYDFNFLTIHGKSRYPGLFAWLRTGQKFTVQVPEGHLLLQSGKQFQWMTGGYINCGYHEVIYTEEVKKAKEKAIKEGKIPWRISSTLFSHIRGDVMLEPIGKYKNEKSVKEYPPILAKDHALKELEDINLAGSKH